MEVKTKENTKTITYPYTAKTKTEIKSYETIATSYYDKDDKDDNDITIICPSDIEIEVTNAAEHDRTKTVICARHI